MLNQFVSIILLYMLVAYPPLYLALSALIIRNAVMNGVGPVATAILMDHSPQQYRSKVSALNSIAWQLFFALGSILGGYLIDIHSFRVPIFLTATFYLIATLLYFVVKREMNKASLLLSQKTNQLPSPT